MSKRFHCEFKKCDCHTFILHCNNLCLTCQHAKLWHSKKSKPPTDSYLSFISPRIPARKPIYTNVIPHIQIAIFVPEVPAIPVSDEDGIDYCINVESLPI
mgnify:CR=1 FL=1|jgi:hypothetical protein